MTELSLKWRETRVRRQLAKYDCRLEKAPSRNWTRKHYSWLPPGYMVISTYTNTVLAGCASHEYEVDIEDIERFSFEYLPRKHGA